MKTAALTALAAALLGACTSTPLSTPADKAAATLAAGPTADARQVATVNATQDPLSDANSPLAKRSIYFDFDSYVLRSDAKPVTVAHAGYLSSHKNRKVFIQGNTDERGGAEYNLALGQKRAEAVKKALSLQGVAEAQMEAVSFGKEKPKAKGSDEASWSENRRADIVYQ
jgi:peptidoglycan-associated lipoprotein